MYSNGFSLEKPIKAAGNAPYTQCRLYAGQGNLIIIGSGQYKRG